MAKKSILSAFKKNKATIVDPKTIVEEQIVVKENDIIKEVENNEVLTKDVVIDELIDSNSEIEVIEQKLYLIIFSDKSEGYTNDKNFKKEGLEVLSCNEVSEVLPFIPFL